jgi:peptidoglycan/xylan/chitin deacetylase (PgdA/CDA1 family)
MAENCKIVMYHYVRPIKNSKYPSIKGLELDSFIRQINHLKKNFHILTATEFLDGLIDKEKIKKKSILLTFDDGLKDHYSHVYPILKKNQLQGLFFISSEPTLKRKILDVHKIHFILEKNGNRNNLVNEIFQEIKKNKDEYNLLSPEEYFSKLSKPNRFDSGDTIFIKRILQRNLPRKLREKIVSDLFIKHVTEDLNSFREEIYLNKDEINEMAENGMYFGSHGHSHEWYTQMNEIQLKNELKTSFNFCSKINYNENRLIFCYPYGNYNEQVVENVSKMGFVAGLTTDVGNAELESNCAYTVKRYDTNDFPQ